MNKIELLTKIKIFKDRAIGYFSLWVYLLVILGYFKIEASNLLVFLFFSACVIASILDYVYIFPKEWQIYGSNIRKES